MVAALTGACSPWRAGGTFALAVVLGIVIGLVITVLTRWLLGKLPAHPAGTALVLVMPSSRTSLLRPLTAAAYWRSSRWRWR